MSARAPVQPEPSKSSPAATALWPNLW
jgi:hypothetical protein